VQLQRRPQHCEVAEAPAHRPRAPRVRLDVDAVHGEALAALLLLLNAANVDLSARRKASAARAKLENKECYLRPSVEHVLASALQARDHTLVEIWNGFQSVTTS
jgi:hypothetical protein